jgi:hypothetical protein
MKLSPDVATSREEALLWQRIKNNPNSFAKDYENAEKMVLENPFSVYYGSDMVVSWEFKNFPCLIESSSNILSLVCCYCPTQDLSYKKNNFML